MHHCMAAGAAMLDLKAGLADASSLPKGQEGLCQALKQQPTNTSDAM